MRSTENLYRKFFDETDFYPHTTRLSRVEWEQIHSSMTIHHIMPGVDIFLNRFHSHTCLEPADQPQTRHVLEINHCRQGRYGCSLDGKRMLYLGPGEMEVNILGVHRVKSEFPLGFYEGLSVMVDVREAETAVRDIFPQLGAQMLFLREHVECNGGAMLLRRVPELNHIFEELYRTELTAQREYVKLKVLELLMIMQTVPFAQREAADVYFRKSDMDKVKALHQEAISRLEEKIPLQTFARQYDIPLTTLKGCFKEIYGSPYYTYMKRYRIASNIRKTLTAHILRLPTGYVDTVGSGRLRRIVHDSSAATETYLAHQLPDSAHIIVTPIAMVVLLFVFDWRYGLVSLIPIALSLGFMNKMTGAGMVEDMRQYQNALENMNNEAVEYVRGMSVVKTFSQTVYSFSRFKKSIDNYYMFCINYTKACRGPMIFFQVALNSAFAFLIVLTLIFCRGGSVAPDILLSFLFYVIFTPVISTSFMRMMYLGEESMTVRDAVMRFQSILSVPPLPEPEHPRTPKDASVTFKNVTFRYQKDANPAVQALSFTIGAGETVAFVGPSGSGKSTTASLVARFWDPETGSVSIGGADVREISKTERVNTVACVFQNSRLLKLSIADNVRLARPDASDEAVRAALHEAQCDDIIDRLPNGMYTMLGTKGTDLSGGERQRIAIARAILQNAPILVLDEATAFADPENEALVQRAIERLAKDKTVIMIAHRLTTIQGADRIYVMKEGRIVQSGTHDELAAENGLYRRMWEDYQSSAQWKVGDRR